MKTTYKLFFLIQFICICSFSWAQNKSIINEVEANIQNYLKQIPVGNESLFGFENRNEFEKIEVGNPIQLAGVKIDNEIDSFIYLIDQWRVPLSLNGQFILFATIQKKNNQFFLVDIGGSLLAAEIQSLNVRHNMILIRDFFNSADYIYTIENKLIRPLHSARNKYSDIQDTLNRHDFYLFLKSKK